MKLYHITSVAKGVQSILTPKIPDNSSPNEEITTERISLAPSIKYCIFGMGVILQENSEIYVYEVEIQNDDEKLIKWDVLYNKGLVDDAPLSREYWYIDKIVPISCEKYRIKNMGKNKYIIINHKYHKKVLHVVEENLGKKVPTEISKLGAVCVLEHYKNSLKMDEIKRKLVHQKLVYDDKQAEIYKMIFGNEPPRYEEEKDYIELEYVDVFDLEKIQM